MCRYFCDIKFACNALYQFSLVIIKYVMNAQITKYVNRHKKNNNGKTKQKNKNKNEIKKIKQDAKSIKPNEFFFLRNFAFLQISFVLFANTIKDNVSLIHIYSHQSYFVSTSSFWGNCMFCWSFCMCCGVSYVINGCVSLLVLSL